MKFSWRRALSSKVFLLLVLAIFIFLVITFSKEFTRRYYLEQQINALQDQVDQLETKNQEISQLIKYFETSTFTEEEARLKMGLKKPGEEVVVINGPEQASGQGTTQDFLATLSNPAKWWYYFVKPN